MEIKIKEAVNIKFYEAKHEKYLEDPEIHEEPKMEFIWSHIGLTIEDILSYRILEKGLIERDQIEIFIVTTQGNLSTNYSKSLHKDLKKIMDDRDHYITEMNEKDLNREG